jgi:IclR family transcriptional regulator, acetate operon repressor
MTSDEADEDARYRVRSVDRAVDILEILADAPSPLTITEIAAATHGSKSGVFATVQTLTARGLIHSSGTGVERRYTLGFALARLGDVVFDKVSFEGLAMPVLRDLTERVGLTSRAAIWGENCAIIVARVNGSDGVRFDLYMGKREALHRSSVGKAMLSVMAEADARDVLTRIPLEPRTSHSLTTIDAVLADIRMARARGYAIDDEEDALGIVCIGAPVLNHRGERMGAISVTRLKAEFGPDEVDTIGRVVAASAASLSRQLGNRT